MPKFYTNKFLNPERSKVVTNSVHKVYSPELPKSLKVRSSLETKVIKKFTKTYPVGVNLTLICEVEGGKIFS